MASFFAFFGVAQAQDFLTGGQGSNLVIKEGKLNINQEDININLHVGFAEVTETYQLQNDSNKSVKATIGFPYKLGERTDGLNNLEISVNGNVISPVSNKDSTGEDFIYWRYFEENFAPNEPKEVKVTFWQMNGSNLRGLRNFSLKTKGLNDQIGKLNIKMVLKDDLRLSNFEKNTNPDLDLRLDPVGWQQSGSEINWHWEDITPGFDLQANFYWPNGDLAKISDLNQNLSLYKINSVMNNQASPQLADSSYLTYWQGAKIGSLLGEKITVDFGQIKEINEFAIIGGDATSVENYLNSSRPKLIKLAFDDGTTKSFTLKDKLEMQYFALSKPVKTQKVTLTFGSAFEGPDKLNNALTISEIEFNNFIQNTSAPVVIETGQKKIPGWQQFFINIWQGLVKLFRQIF